MCFTDIRRIMTPEDIQNVYEERMEKMLNNV